MTSQAGHRVVGNAGATGAAARPPRTSARISALLPLKVSGRHYGENLARLDLLFSSLVHFAAPDLFSEILVVVREDEAEVIGGYLEQWSELPTLLVLEDPLLPEFREFSRPWQVRPWQRQQIIKLSAPAITDSDFVLVLDPDVVAVRPLRYDALFPQGRALLEPEDRAVHRQWWIDSADLLCVSAGLGRPGMSVTPALLSTAIISETQRRLERVGGRPWVETLLTSYCEWTEYTLYLLTAESSGILDQHHIWSHDPAAPAHLHVDPVLSVWDRRGASAGNIDRLFAAAAPGLFAIIQSNTGLPASEIASVMARHFPVRSVAASTAPITTSEGSKLRERSRIAARVAAQRVYRTRRWFVRRCLR